MKSPLTDRETSLPDQSGHRVRKLIWAALACAGLLGSGDGWALAQLAVRDPTQPILVLNTGGHSAPVRALIFTTERSQLLSAGTDKILNVWDLDDGARLSRTIRPPIWRGLSGSIHAMALSPVADARGQRLLATAGVGVENQGGNITLFRFPGSQNATNGDLIGQLTSGVAPNPQGHTESVTSLAFNPSGAFLVSGGNDADVRVWDVANRRTVAVLRGHSGPVSALAFLAPDRLVTAGRDGTVRLWDFNRRVEVARAAPRNPNAKDPAGDAINALAVSPAGGWITIGRENGVLTRYDARLQAEVNLPTSPTQGAVEALAPSHDGKWLASSLISSRRKPGDRGAPRGRCDVELRAMPDGKVQSKLAETTSLVYACAFDPRDRFLAFAGGDAQSLFLHDRNAPENPLKEVKGQGSAIREVGFRADSLAVGFARQPSEGTTLWGFDLAQWKLTTLNREGLQLARTSHDGWTVQEVDPHHLDVRNALGNGFRLDLDERRDGRWWSYSFVPPGPRHPVATLAVGTDTGLAVFRLSDGRRTRFFAGHGGPVVTLAPSPDGRWLATGSTDQTVKLWRLADSDAPARLGARFAQDGAGAWTVADVEPQSFAELAGLIKGDVVEQFAIGTELFPSERFGEGFGRIDTEPPGVSIQFELGRGPGARQRVKTLSTRRDVQALTLFPGLDLEWVLWTPHGYYETSIAGDRKFLGWHRNAVGPAGVGVDLTKPTDYFPINKYEKELRQPDVLRRLIATGDPVPAVAGLFGPAADPTQLVLDDSPPAVEVVAPDRPIANVPLVVRAPVLPVRVHVTTEPRAVGRRLIQSVSVLVDSHRVVQEVLNPLQPEDTRDLQLNLNPGLHKINVVATNDRGRERVVSFDVRYDEPAPPPEQLVLPPPRLVVLAIGSNAFPNARYPAIPFADHDARDVGGFLAEPGGKRRFDRVDLNVLAGADATADRIQAAVAKLDSDRQSGKLGTGDTVFLMVESHLLVCKRKALIVAEDAGAAVPPAPAVDAEEVASVLGRLADYGCKVIVLVDGVHERTPDPKVGRADVAEWVRDLNRKNVIAFIASIHGPSRRINPRTHGVFAEGVIQSLNVRARARLVADPDRPYTLDDFQDSVRQVVSDLTERRQLARCYVPETIESRVPIFDPPPIRRPQGELRAAK